MIRTRELATFLSTIAATVTHELRPDLQSGQAKKSADFLIQAIDRLAAQLRDGERIGTEHGPRWRALREQFPAAAAATIATHEGVTQRERLEAELDALQSRLAEPATFSALAHELAERRPAASHWFREAVIASRDLLEALEDSAQPAPARAAAASGGDIDGLQRRLSAYLGAKYPALPPQPIVKFDIAAGGSTKLTALFSLRPNPALPERLVLRQDLAMSITGASVVDEYPIVEQLHRCGLKVPQPILLEADPAVLGGRFMIMTEIADSVPAGTYFAKERARQPFMIGPEFARDAAAELARLHTRTATSGLAPRHRRPQVPR
ncbi:MAG: hypothetical protein U1F11_14405 [Steroidobacteraceae bacterium]